MAKKFQFRLEQVLNLRKQIEDAKIRELAQAKNRLLEIENALKIHAEIELEFLETYTEMEKAGSFNTDQVMVYCDYKDWLRRKEKEYHAREKEWIKEVERRRQEAVKASRQRQLLDNFKDRQKDKYEKIVLGEEQKFLDEVSSIAFVRRERAKKMIASS
jgi:flagellar export protein FliJ